MDYVLVYARSINRTFEDVLLVLKDRPPWQAGMLNLVGGKIEKGETPEEAALRELKEESGLDGERPLLMGAITGPWGFVIVFEFLFGMNWQCPPRAKPN